MKALLAFSVVCWGVTPTAEIIAEWKEAAANGDPAAQFNLGVAYRIGKGVPEDDKEAVKWYRKAAEQGFAAAQYNLGFMYDDGTGVPEDDKESIKWYRKLRADLCLV